MPRTEYRVARQAVQLAGAVLLLCLLAAGAAALPGCSLVQPQKDIAVLCAQINDRNAGVTCVKAGYAAVRDLALLTEQRYTQGRISLATAKAALRTLEEANRAVEIAEVAVALGAYSDAEARLDAVIALLDRLEATL